MKKTIFLLILALLFCGCAKTEEQIIDSSFRAADIQPKVESVYASNSEASRTFAVLENGSVWFWGKNIDITKEEYEDQLLPEPFVLNGIELRSNIKDICFAGNATFILLKNGDLYSFGENCVGGILGDGTSGSRNEAKRILQNVKQLLILEVGINLYYKALHPETEGEIAYSAAALTNAGELYTWGFNGNGTLYNSTFDNSPWPAVIGTDIDEIFLRSTDSLLAVTKDGDVLGGRDTEESRATRLEKLFSAKGKIKSVSSSHDADGNSSIIVLLSDGTLWEHSKKSTQILSNVKAYESPYILTDDGTLYSFDVSLEPLRKNISRVNCGYITDSEGITYTIQNKEWIKTPLKAPVSVFADRHYIDKDGTLYSFGVTQALGIELNDGEEFIEVPVKVLFPTRWNQ